MSCPVCPDLPLFKLHAFLLLCVAVEGVVRGMVDALEGGKGDLAAATAAAPATAAAAPAAGAASETRTESLQQQNDTASGAPSGANGGQDASSGGREQPAAEQQSLEQQSRGGNGGEQPLTGGVASANGEPAKVKVEAATEAGPAAPDAAAAAVKQQSGSASPAAAAAAVPRSAQQQGEGQEAGQGEGGQGHSRQMFRAWLGNIGLHRRTPEAGASPQQAAGSSGEHTAAAGNSAAPAQAAHGAQEKQQAASDPQLVPLQAATVAAAALPAAAGGLGGSLAGRKRALDEGSGAGASQTTSLKVRRLDSLLADDAGTGRRLLSDWLDCWQAPGEGLRCALLHGTATTAAVHAQSWHSLTPSSSPPAGWARCACCADDAVGLDVAGIGCKDLEGRWCRVYWPEEDEW